MSGHRGEVIVAEWHDSNGKLHQITIDLFGNVQSIAYTSDRPSGRPRTIHRLTNLPLRHLEEHFGPLMRADYEVAMGASS